MSARVFDDAVVEAAAGAINAGLNGGDDNEYFLAHAALSAAADALEGAIRAEALAPVAALAESITRGVRLDQGSTENYGVKVRDLRAVIADPDAVAKHNAAIAAVERERIAQAIEAAEVPEYGIYARTDGHGLGIKHAARIAREETASTIAADAWEAGWVARVAYEGDGDEMPTNPYSEARPHHRRDGRP